MLKNMKKHGQKSSESKIEDSELGNNTYGHY